MATIGWQQLRGNIARLGSNFAVATFGAARWQHHCRCSLGGHSLQTLQCRGCPAAQVIGRALVVIAASAQALSVAAAQVPLTVAAASRAPCAQGCLSVLPSILPSVLRIVVPTARRLKGTVPAAPASLQRPKPSQSFLLTFHLRGEVRMTMLKTPLWNLDSGTC